MTTATARTVRIFTEFDDEPEEKPSQGPQQLRGVKGMSIALFNNAVHDATDYGLPLVDIIDARKFLEHRGWIWLRNCGATYQIGVPNENRYLSWLEGQREIWEQAADHIVECRQHRPNHSNGTRLGCQKCRRVTTIKATLDILARRGIAEWIYELEQQYALKALNSTWAIYARKPEPATQSAVMDSLFRLNLTRLVLLPLVRCHRGVKCVMLAEAEQRAREKVVDLMARHGEVHP